MSLLPSQKKLAAAQLKPVFSSVYKIFARLINSVSLSGGCSSSQDFVMPSL